MGLRLKFNLVLGSSFNRVRRSLEKAMQMTGD